MNEDGQSGTRKLRWWFWLVLFAPAMVALSAPAAGSLLRPSATFGLILALNLYVALPLNFVCSNWTAKQIVLLRDPRGGSSPWMFLWGPLIFFLNVTIVFGGCLVMTARYR